MYTLTMIHTVSWYDKSVITPFATDWLRLNPDVQMINIMDDSLLAESLEHGGPTEEVAQRMKHYVQAAVATGADVIMSTCTTMGSAVNRAQENCPVPLFNIDEPMARLAVAQGKRLGILATVPTSAPATRALLEREAKRQNKAVEIQTVINEPAFAALLAEDLAEHNRLVHAEMDRLASSVDVIVLGQISLAQISHRPSGVVVLQVGHSGFAHARQLLDGLEAKPMKQPTGSPVGAC